MLTFLSFAFVITVLVFIHELGHYLAARSVGMRVEKFSVGFPPRFISFTSVPGGWDFRLFFYRKNKEGKVAWLPILEKFIKRPNKKGSGTEYCLALLPLGGYVKVSGILDESMDPNSKGAEYEYQSKKTWQKLWFTSAGVIFNFILAFLIFTFLFMYNGYPKNKIGYVIDKLSTVKVENMKINGESLNGDENFFIGINHSPSILDTTKGVIEIDNFNTELSIYNLNAETIKSIEFSLPIQIQEIKNGLKDSTERVRISHDGKNIRVESINNSDILNNRGIYLGKISHDKLEHQKSPASDKLRKGDRILSINNHKVKYYLEDIKPLIAQENLDESQIKDLNIEIERGSEKNKLIQIKPVISERYNEYGELIKYAQIGITSETEDVGFFEAISISFKNLLDKIGKTFKGIFELITGQLSGKSVSGPIGIAKISGEFASQGFIPLLSLMAFLSISLGVINILPFPGLDGGHALIAIIEKIKGSKISAKTQVRIQQFGMLILMSLFFLIILKDLGII